MRFVSLLPAASLVSFALAAAEPVVQPGDLPRIPPTPPEKAAETFTVRPGFRLELMAAEPLVVSPVAMTFDEDGRLYVVEMIDYSERREEKLSRLKLLTDTDGDGRYDRASVFAAGLPWATAVTCWDGGIFAIAAPDLLYLKDTDGDGQADVHALVATGFGNLGDRLNVQGLPNYLQWGPDQRIHGANGTNPSRLSNFARRSDPPLELRGRDFSFDPRVLQLRAELGGGQWGMSFDALGRKFSCNNSRHLTQLLYDIRALSAGIPLPPAQVDIPVDGPQAEVFRQSPEEPWRVIRTRWRVTGTVKGAIEGGGRSSGYFTSAAGATVYRGDAFPPEYHGDVFIADCGSNLIHRKKLSGEIQLKAARAADEQKSEFAASRDNWCRPVFFANAPDGSLWFCDTYREVVEHPWSLPEPLKAHLDLNSGNDRGRLWRIVPDGFQPRPQPRLGQASTGELVKLLAHPNGWHRETAARLLHLRQDAQAVPLLRQLATQSLHPPGRYTALRVLAGQNALDEATLAATLADADAGVRAQALKLLPASLSPALELALSSLGDDPSPRVRYELAWALSGRTAQAKGDLLRRLIGRSNGDAWAQTALLAAVGDEAGRLFSACAASPDPDELAFARALARTIGARKRPAEIDAVISQARAATDPAAWLAPLSEGLARGGTSLAKMDAGQKLAPLLAAAEARIGQGIGELRGDFTLLGLAGGTDSVRIIATALATGLPAEQTGAAIEALGRLNPAGLGISLAQAWPKIPAEARPAALRQWRSRPQQLASLLAAVEQGVVGRQELSAEDLATLRTIKDPALQTRVAALFGAGAGRQEVLASFQPALQLPGDAAKGRATFQARCTICHRFRGDGQGVGPDLDASAAAGREKLLGNILEPSREITAGFAAATVETRQGENLAGVVVAESEGAVTLRLPGGQLRQLPPLEVARIERHTRSLMPDGLEAGLAPQDMADLLEFLAAAR